jgi:predicted DNA-binding protein
MAVMSIRIDDKKRKALKVIASLEGKSMGGLVSELIEDYITKNKKKITDLGHKADILELMKLSDSSFSEWDNPEDEIYNDL